MRPFFSPFPVYRTEHGPPAVYRRHNRLVREEAAPSPPRQAVRRERGSRTPPAAEVTPTRQPLGTTSLRAIAAMCVCCCTQEGRAERCVLLTAHTHTPRAHNACLQVRAGAHGRAAPADVRAAGAVSVGEKGKARGIPIHTYAQPPHRCRMCVLVHQPRVRRSGAAARATRKEGARPSRAAGRHLA